MAKKPVKKRKSSRSADKKRRVPVPAKNLTRRLPVVNRNEEEMLTEFSDETNDFYVDEMQERKKRARQAQQQKKKEKKSERRKPMSPARRKLIRVLSYGAIISVVLIVGVILSLTVLFKTQVYEVTGNTRYEESAIISACGISKGENIFLAPKSSAEKRIKNEFPYVEDVEVSFKIPDTIKISVIEAVDGYLVKNSDTDYLVISTKGRILNRVTETGGYDLPIFIGPKLVSGELGDYVSYEDDTVVTMIDSITTTFADNGYQGITEIDATNTADISFTYDDRIKVKLGIPEDLSYKIRTAMTIINENLDKNQSVPVSGILDVSRCNSTKRSYFNEGAINPTVAPTVDPSQAATEPYYGDYTWDSGGYDEYDLGYDYYDEDGYGHYW